MCLNLLNLDPRGLRAELQRQQAEQPPTVSALLASAAQKMREAAGPAPVIREDEQ